ncbi:MAG TPA: sulfatase-like hydrolase/transferase [Pirellulales bacterium]|nr:sulfatase-like hydrolase/transferase [Pirellulales bacterium]
MIVRRVFLLLVGLALTPLIASAQDRQSGKTIRLLTVGNSFSRNATKYLDQIAEAGGNTLIHHACVIGGSGPDQHLAKAAIHEKDPTDKAGLYASGMSLKQELLAEKWDVITIQQASVRSHDVANYRPAAKQLYDYIKKYAPTSEVVIHQTWAYRVDDPRFQEPSGSLGEPQTQKEMYDGLSAAYSTIANELGIRRIPVGDAFYAADTDPKWGYKPDLTFDPKRSKPPELPDQTHSLHVGWRWVASSDKTSLGMDGHHASAAGEYLGGLVFYEFLFGCTAVGNTFHPEGMDAEYAYFLQQTADRAVARAIARPTAPTVKPNIVFILADDLGFMDIGANNPHSFYETPNVDRLAKRGVRFTQGYAACCVCSPTRASIMTGKYPPRVGITDYIPGMRNGKLKSAPNADHLALEEVTVAETLRDAGYATFFAGKWHLGGGEYFPGAQGFPKELVNGGSGKKENVQFWYPVSDAPIPDRKDDPKTTDRIVNEAVRFIESHRDTPFFAYLPFLAVHTPIGARADLVSKYERKKASAPEDAWGRERERDVRLVQNNATYAAMLEQLDRAIGRVLAALENNGLEERTIIVFMSDNGGLSTSEGHPTSNVPLRAGKGWPYEGGVREPWIVAAPGVTKRGSTCDTPVISTDFYPTLLELAGLPLQPEQHRDGVSFAPLLRGEPFERGMPLFWHYPHYGNQGGAPYGAIRAGDWKLIEWYEDGAVELYNIPADISEQNNLAGQHPERARALHEKLIAWRKDVGAVMPEPNPDFVPSKRDAPAAGRKQ